MNDNELARTEANSVRIIEADRDGVVSIPTRDSDTGGIIPFIDATKGLEAAIALSVVGFLLDPPGGSPVAGARAPFLTLATDYEKAFPIPQPDISITSPADVVAANRQFFFGDL